MKINYGGNGNGDGEGIYNTGKLYINKDEDKVLELNSYSCRGIWNQSYTEIEDIKLYNDGIRNREHILSSGTLIMHAGEFTGVAYGGDRYSYNSSAISCSSGTATLSNININLDAGAGINNSGNLTITDSRIVSARNNGGSNTISGIRSWEGSKNNITNCTISVANGIECKNYNNTLNIKNSTITGTSGSGIFGAITNLQLENCNVEATSFAIRNPSGTVKILGGTYKTTTSDASISCIENSGTITLGEKITEEGLENNEEANNEKPYIESKTIGLKNTGTFNFYDGKIVGSIDNAIDGNPTKLEDGYQVSKTNNQEENTQTAILKKLAICEIVTFKTETNNQGEDVVTETVEAECTSIDSLKNAMNTIQKNSYTIRVSRDFHISADAGSIIIPANCEVTFDLNGHTINSANTATFVNNGVLKMIDSQVEASETVNAGKFYNTSGGNVIQNNGNASIQSGTYQMDGNGTSNAIKECIINNGTLQILDGTITANGNSYVRLISSVEDGTTQISGGTINATGAVIYNDSSNNLTISGGSVISATINNGGTGNITINDSAVISETINNTGTGVVTLNGGTSSNVSMSNGKLVINGQNTVAQVINLSGSSEFTMNAGRIRRIDIKSNDVVANIYGGEIICTVSSYAINFNSYSATVNIGKKDANVETEAPYIKGYVNNKVIYSEAGNATVNYYDGKIVCGEDFFSTININEIPEKYHIKTSIDEDENYVTTLDNSEEIASANGIKCTSIEEAFEKCTAQTNTIKLLQDTTIANGNYIIPSGKNITFDLNGNKLYTYVKDKIFINSGTFKLMDSSEASTGEIIGYTPTFVSNTGNLNVAGGKYELTILYSAEQIKFIENTGSLVWENATANFEASSNVANIYGIYNTGEGIIDFISGSLVMYAPMNVSTNRNQCVVYTSSSGEINWNNGEIYLKRNDGNYSQYGIYNVGNGDINIDKITYNTYGPTGYIWAMQKLIQCENTTKCKIVIDDLNTEELADRKDVVYGVTGKNADVTINGGTWENYKELINLTNSKVTINAGTFAGSIIVSGESLEIKGGTLDSVTTSCTDNTLTGGTIKNYTQSGTGTTEMTDGGNLAVNSVSLSGGTFNQNSGTIQSTTGVAVTLTGGTFNQLAGTIETTSDGSSAVNITGSNTAFVMGENDGNVIYNSPSVKAITTGVNNASGNFYFYDGIIEAATPTLGTAETPTGYKISLSEDGDIATLDIIAEVDKIVSVGNNYYTNMNSAISAANASGEDIVLFKNVEIENTIVIPAGAVIRINLNAYNMISEMENPIIINNGNLTIIDDISQVQGTITEAKMENTSGYAIINNGILAIGEADAPVQTITPNIKGNVAGNPSAIKNQGTLNLYYGKIDDQPITPGTQTANAYILARRYQLSANNFINRVQENIIAAISSPKISVDKELPEWTKDSVTVTLGSSNRIILDIVEEDLEGQIITVRKEWKVKEPDKYKATLRLVKIVDGERIPVVDKNTGEDLTVEITGNASETFSGIPKYEDGSEIEYKVEEVKVEKLDEETGTWKQVSRNMFEVTYPE